MINRTNLLAFCICLLFACKEDESINPLEGTQWASPEPDYFDFSANSELNYYESFVDTTRCFEYSVITYTVEGDSLFLTATDFEVRVRFEIIGDTLYSYDVEGTSRLARKSFSADTLQICP